MPPPSGAVPPDGTPGESGFDFTRFGVRVPAVLVSPLIPAGTVFRVAAGAMPLDHTSVLKTVEMRWGLPALTRRGGPDPGGVHLRGVPDLVGLGPGRLRVLARLLFGRPQQLLDARAGRGFELPDPAPRLGELLVIRRHRGHRGPRIPVRASCGAGEPSATELAALRMERSESPAVPTQDPRRARILRHGLTDPAHILGAQTVDFHGLDPAAEAVANRGSR